MKEKAYLFGNNLLGILSEPENSESDYPCVLLLNSGMIHKIGPNRLYVKLARTLVKSGYKVFRFDFSGVGDSPIAIENEGDFETSARKNTQEAMDFLNSLQGMDRFILFGICSGADISFQTGAFDKRVSGIITINGYLVENASKNYSDSDISRSITLRYYKKNMFNLTRWKKVITGQSNLFSRDNFTNFYKFFLKKLKLPGLRFKKNENIRKGDNNVLKPWNQMIENNTRILQIYSEGSDAFEVFRKTLKNKLGNFVNNNTVELMTIPDVDHVFTPVWAQEYLINEVTNRMNNWFNGKN